MPQIRWGNRNNFGIISLLFFFLKKTYFVIPHKNHLAQTVLRRGHNVCFCCERRKNMFKLSITQIHICVSISYFVYLITSCISSLTLVYIKVSQGYVLLIARKWLINYRQDMQQESESELEFISNHVNQHTGHKSHIPKTREAGDQTWHTWSGSLVCR